jgi:hypothetical protein
MAERHSAEDKAQFITIFRNNATDISRSCKAYGISRQAFYDWYKADPVFAAAVDDEREAMKDFGESQLLTMMKGIPKLNEQGKQVGWISRPDTACIIFFNKTKNKDRGYDERSIIKREGNWLDDITIQVTTVEQAKALKEFLTSEEDADTKVK